MTSQSTQPKGTGAAAGVSVQGHGVLFPFQFGNPRTTVTSRPGLAGTWGQGPQSRQNHCCRVGLEECWDVSIWYRRPGLTPVQPQRRVASTQGGGHVGYQRTMHQWGRQCHPPCRNEPTFIIDSPKCRSPRMRGRRPAILMSLAVVTSPAAPPAACCVIGRSRVLTSKAMYERMQAGRQASVSVATRAERQIGVPCWIKRCAQNGPGHKPRVPMAFDPKQVVVLVTAILIKFGEGASPTMGLCG